MVCSFSFGSSNEKDEEKAETETTNEEKHSFLEQIKKVKENMFSFSSNEENQTSPRIIPSFHKIFKLPITYLEDIHPILPTTATDLELMVTNETFTEENQKKKNETRKSMYEYLFRPSHAFAKQLIPEWGKHFTSNIEYLKDTQKTILNMEHFQVSGGFAPVEAAKPPTPSSPNIPSSLLPEKDVPNIIHIWNSLKNDDFFLDKYGYMDWTMLLYLNNSSSFLQWLTVVNLMSPITSLLVPIVFIIFPFLLLKIQQIPIDFTTYIKVLGDIAQNHFIGKVITLENLSYDKIVYLLFSAGMYFLQIYQNIRFCFSFYKNIQQISKQLYDVREYVSKSIRNMKLFILHNKHKSYLPFIQQMEIALGSLLKLENELSCFKKENFHPVFNVHDMGYILKMYYVLYSNIEYEKVLLYSFGFDGYLDNLNSVWNHYKKNKMNLTSFSSCSQEENSLFEIKNQYYIPYVNIEPVKTDCNLKDNMIISGVNASGKTTFLKTTTLNVLFSQQLGMGCFQSMQFTPYTQIHSYLNIPDTSDRDSLFQAEARRCKNIIDIINSEKRSRHFCIFDELYSGTNPSEASKSAYAFLLYLSKYQNVNFMITTHYNVICNKLAKKTKLKINGIQRRIRNFKTEVIQNEDGSIKYKYKLTPGICRIQGAIEVLKNMNYPKDIINNYVTLFGDGKK